MISTDPSWTFEAIHSWLAELPGRFPGAVSCVPVGASHEGRPITLVKLGRGPKRVLAWSQMHGDEPTHTAVLVRLVEGLLADPACPQYQSTLTGVTLGIVPMLNPDGAVRGTRHNAQGIDINRDARDLATPEGRTLRSLVERFRPQVALNLHNQNHRTRLADRPVPVGVALLAPPIDDAGTTSPCFEDATRLAAAVREAVWPACDGRVTRYDADYMPTAFGEWFQGQGVATVLIEAGGSRAGDPSMVDLHALAVQTALCAVADGSFRQADPQGYLALKRQGEHRLFDVLIERAAFGDGQIDIGVNFPDRSQLRPNAAGGRIAEIGDLADHGGIRTLSALGAVCLPGRTCWAECRLDSVEAFERDCTEAVRTGVTTLLAPITHEALASGRVGGLLDRREGLPVNVALVAEATNLTAARLLDFIRAGVVALLADDAHEVLLRSAEGLGLPVLGRESAPRLSDPAPRTIGVWREEASRMAGLCGFAGRGQVQRCYHADLVVCESGADGAVNDVRAVLVAGVESVGSADHTSGVLLRRTLQANIEP